MKNKTFWIDEYGDPRLEHIMPVVLLGIFLIITIICSFTTIKSGEVGLKVRFGKIVETSLSEGFNLKIPYIEKIKKINIKVQKYENETALSSSSKDLQIINNIIINVNYQINPQQATELYRNVGEKYEETIITPAIQESVKSVISQYTAEELVTRRSEVANAINDNLNNKLNNYGINILSTAIKNFDFSQEYNTAIERKVVASQQVLTAQQELEKAKVEAETKRVEAEGEAKANKEVQQTITKDILIKEFIEKWNGVLPETYAGDDIMGIFNLK